MVLTSLSTKRVSFYTLGCRLNQSETAVVQRTFEHEAYTIVPFSEPADIVVINTCTVTENGDADTRRLVNKVNRINPDAQIALIGCQAQVQKEKLKVLPNVRWIVGNARKFDLRSIIEELQEEEARVIAPTIDREPFTIPFAGVDPNHTRANIKIQDGCDFFCSFCEIPYARGRARSRVFDDIAHECRALVKAGHKEIVITGINVGTYDNEGKTILDIVDALEAIAGLERIRISSIEPTTIPTELFDRMASGGKLCRYLHIPLQSGHNEVLENMKRKYNVREFESFIQTARQRVADICIGTDVIVGFPGETEEQFQETADRLREWPIDYMHVFSYSNRQMAKSRHRGDPVAPAEIQRRSKVLRDLSQRKRTIFYNRFLNSVQPVLFEQVKDGRWTGVTDHYLRVQASSTENLENTIRPVRLQRLEGSVIIGELA